MVKVREPVRPQTVVATRAIQRTLEGHEAPSVSRLPSLNRYSHEKGHTPVHAWYTTVAGYSADFVLGIMREAGVGRGSTVIDPFSGTGTTALVAAPRGASVLGIEANPFHQLVAKTKTNFRIDRIDASHTLKRLRARLKSDLGHDGRYSLKLVPKTAIPDHLSSIKATGLGPAEMPHLARWMSPRVLARVRALDEAIQRELDSVESSGVGDLVRLAFGSILLPVSNMQLAGPKIAYRRQSGTRVDYTDAPVVGLFLKKLEKMVRDLASFGNQEGWVTPDIRLGDSRTVNQLFDQRADLAITSPPYLNEVDYIENTRLELYFLGFVRTEADMHALKLRMIRANSKYLFRENRDYPDRLPSYPTFSRVLDYCRRIERIWAERDWGWDHPRLVAEYFCDLSRHLDGMRRVLKDGSKYVLVVGDSAIDGILVPTDELICSLGTDAGFSKGKVEPFRYRSSSRHPTRLRESVVTLTA